MTNHYMDIAAADAEAQSSCAAPQRARQRRSRPDGSRAHRIENAVLTATLDCGHAVDFDAIRQAYNSQNPDSPLTSYEMSNSLGSLVRNFGSVVMMEGYPGRATYRHRDHEVPEGPEILRVLSILSVVHDLYAQHGRPLTAMQVRSELMTRGDHHLASGVTALLSRFSRARRAGPLRWRQPTLTELSVARIAHRPTRCWRPSDAPVTDRSDTPRPSRFEAVRLGILDAERRLGRPVTVLELWWWRDAFVDTNVAASVLKGAALTGVLSDVVDDDAPWKGEPGRLQRFANRLTTYGGVSPRYGTVESSGSTQQAHFEDAVSVFRAARELAGIELLERQASSTRSPELAALADQRRRALLSAVVELVGTDDLLPLATGAQTAYEELTRWWQAARTSVSGTTSWARSNQATTLHDDIAAILRAARAQSPDRGSVQISRARLVGSTALVSSVDLAPYTDSVVRRLNREHSAVFQICKRARRFPPPAEVLEGRRVPHTQNLLDRVDALLALYRTMSAALPGALLTRASVLIGHVIRDPQLLRESLGAPADPALRHAMLVALSLLGVATSHEDPLGRMSDEADAAAFALATAVADPTNAAVRLRAAQRGLRHTLRAVLEDSARRAESGDLIAVIR